MKLQHPLDVKCYFNPKQNDNEFLLVADSYNNCVKKIEIKSKTAKKLIPANEIHLNEPNGICIDQINSNIYITDTNNHSIKLIKNLDINSAQVQIEEFPIRFSDNVNSFEIEKISIDSENCFTVLLEFNFKLNQNAENTWKVTINGLTSKNVNGIFKQNDKIDWSKERDVYKLDRVLIENPHDITSIKLDLNIVYCENTSSKLCKIFKNTKILYQSEIKQACSNSSSFKNCILFKIVC